jgi:hypothetical protein
VPHRFIASNSMPHGHRTRAGISNLLPPLEVFGQNGIDLLLHRPVRDLRCRNHRLNLAGVRAFCPNRVDGHRYIKVRLPGLNRAVRVSCRRSSAEFGNLASAHRTTLVICLPVSGALCFSRMAVCPMCARMPAFPPDYQERRECKCPWAKSGGQSKYCSCESAESPP